MLMLELQFLTKENCAAQPQHHHRAGSGRHRCTTARPGSPGFYARRNMESLVTPQALRRPPCQYRGTRFPACCSLVSSSLGTLAMTSREGFWFFRQQGGGGGYCPYFGVYANGS